MGFILFFVFLFVISCSQIDDRLSKESIFALVENNFSGFEKTQRIKGIQSVEAEEEIIDFYCGGAGFGSSRSYCEFYYITEDDITAIWCAGPEEEMVEDGEGYFYRQKDGDNYYYTEKICENFYYYEASF